MNDKPILLSIDPSVRSLGWAVVDLNQVDEDNYYDLNHGWYYGVVPMDAATEVGASKISVWFLKHRWNTAYRDIASELEMEGLEPNHFVAEWPTFFNTMKGRVAVSGDYLSGLASMIGYLVGRFDFDVRHVMLYTPMEWKGSVPKHVTRNRFIECFGKSAEREARKLTDDTIDAIMIARHWLRIYANGQHKWQKEEMEVN